MESVRRTHDRGKAKADRDVMRLLIWTIFALLAPALLTACLPSRGKQPLEIRSPSGGPTLIEFNIRQDMDLIRHSLFGEPPQFAIWLEDPVTHGLRTVFVTYRSASGHWIGKTKCPAALPRWFEVFKQETNSTELPSSENPAPDAVTGATPQTEHFRTSVEVEPHSRWICWIEMNLAGDFNDAYRDHDVEKKTVDVYFSGQPPLVYRGEITAIPGGSIVPELYGQSVLDGPVGETVQPVSDDVTTARNIFKAIEVRVVRTG